MGECGETCLKFEADESFASRFVDPEIGWNFVTLRGLMMLGLRPHIDGGIDLDVRYVWISKPDDED